jgi:hypothetical protein
MISEYFIQRAASAVRLAVESGILPSAFHYVSIKLVCCLSCCPLRCGSQERNCVPVNIVKRIKSIELETHSNCTGYPLSGDRVERCAQSRAPFGPSDRSCRDGKSRQPARPWSRQLIPATGVFSSTAQTSPHVPSKASATPHAPAARETSPILRRPEQSRLRENAQAVGRQEESRVTGPPKARSESKKAVKAAYAVGFNAVSREPRCSQYRTGEMYSPTPCELWAVLLKPTPNRNPAPTDRE